MKPHCNNVHTLPLGDVVKQSPTRPLLGFVLGVGAEDGGTADDDGKGQLLAWA